MTAAPGFRLIGLRHAAVEPAHGRTQLFLQGINAGDLNTQDATQSLIRIGVTRIGEARELIQHSFGLLPKGKHLIRQGQLVTGNARQQRAVAVSVFSDSRLLIEEHIFKRRQPLYHHTGTFQLQLGQIGKFVQQVLGLARHHISLVRPELDLPATIALGQWPDHQRLQAGPGRLALVECLLQAGQFLIATAPGPGAVQQGHVATLPLLVRRQQHLIGQLRGDLLARITAGSQHQGGNQHYQALHGNLRMKANRVTANSGKPTAQRAARRRR